MMATASSRRAAGRSLPKILARADRAAAPPRVPMTAPIAPPAIRRRKGAARDADGGAAYRAGDDAEDEGWRRFSTGCGGELVDDQFAESGDAEDPTGPGVAEKGEPAGVQVDPAEAGGPADDGGSSHGSEAGDDADEDREDQKGHGGL